MVDMNAVRSLLSLGSNLGDRHWYMDSALTELSAQDEIKILRRSPTIETDPMDVLNQPKFLNQVIEIETSLEPLALLSKCQKIESKLGRLHRMDKGPREIDIDILTYGNREFRNERLQIPHHSIESRPFIQELIDALV